MTEDELPKQQDKQHIERPDINKGHDAERSGFEKLHAPNRGNLSEGYQPIRDIATPPPDGGSGVPDKEKDS